MDSLGKKGEKTIACKLEKEGYIILECNWRTRSGEVDIIALDGNTIVFIEVKTLINTNISDLDIIINKKKQSRICKTAKYFLSNNRQYNRMNARFDVIVLQSNPFLAEPLKILHLKNAFGDCDE